MNLKEKNPWKACFAFVLIALVIITYIRYPDYDTTAKRTELLSEKAETEVAIIDEVTIDGYTVCQLRIGDQTGCALFKETLGKTDFQRFITTSSDRLVESFASGGKTWLILVCDQPEVSYAVMHFYDYGTGTYSTADPIDLEGRQILVTPHHPELGSYDHTVYYDSSGNPL